MEKENKGFWRSAVSLFWGEKRSWTGPVSGTDHEGIMRLFNLGDGVTIPVSNETALSISAYLNCIVVLSEDVSALPCSVYQNTGKGKVVNREHHVHKLLHDNPNRFYTPCQFWRMQLWKTAAYGNSVNIIRRNGVGRAIEIVPVAKGDWALEVSKDGSSLLYTIHSVSKTYSADDILHYKRFEDGGLIGKSLVAYQKDMLGVGISAQKYAKRTYETQGGYDTVITTERKISDPAAEVLKKSINDTRSATVSSENKTLVLPEGMKLERMNFSPDEVKFMDTQKWNAQSVAGLFRVPLEMLGITENSNNSIAEQSVLNYVKFGLNPWLVMIEQENNKKLFREQEKGEYYTKFNLNALQRGDLATRTEAYAKMYDRGLLCGNDIMDMEDRPHYKNGDMRFIPVNNVVPLDKVEAYADSLINKQLTTKGDGKGVKGNQ